MIAFINDSMTHSRTKHYYYSLDTRFAILGGAKTVYSDCNLLNSLLTCYLLDVTHFCLLRVICSCFKWHFVVFVLSEAHAYFFKCFLPLFCVFNFAVTLKIKQNQSVATFQR